MREIFFIGLAIVWYGLGLLNLVSYSKQGDLLFAVAIFIAASLGASLLVIHSSSPDEKDKKKSTKE